MNLRLSTDSLASRHQASEPPFAEPPPENLRAARDRPASTDGAFARRTSVASASLRWLTINDQPVPVATSLERPATPVPWDSVGREVNAGQLSHALREQAPDLLASYARRFARDVGFELCALHNNNKRAYLNVQLVRVNFWPPATFRLDPYGGERSLNSPMRQEPIADGTFGFAPEEQAGGAANFSERALRAIDTFSWAASVAAFAIGEPLLPDWQAKEPSRAWLSQVLRVHEASPEAILASDERRFFSYWGLDVACQLIKDASGEEDASPGHARVRPLLLQWGSPWPELYETLGPLFLPLLDCFDLQQSARPKLGDLLHRL